MTESGPFGRPRFPLHRGASLALLAGRTLRDLAVLREARGDKVPALNLLARAQFRSSAAFQGFVEELGEGNRTAVGEVPRR